MPLFENGGISTYNPNEANMNVAKPISKYMENNTKQQDEDAKNMRQLKYFQGQNMELHCLEKTLNPSVEKEIKECFFEIKKKFEDEDGNIKESENEK